jgi:antibiotic biosynthesis monooxygenase (ABM) superfamily enzyme
MARLFVRHKVNDYSKWRKVYDDFEETRTGMGEIGDSVYQLAGDSNDVTVIHDFDSVDRAKAFMESSELREAMGNAGVAGRPDIWITDET